MSRFDSFNTLFESVHPHFWTGLCRIIFGLLLVFCYLRLWPYHLELFGPSGLHGYDFFNEFASAPGIGRQHTRSIQFLTQISSATTITFLYLTLIFSAMLFALGIRPRISGFLSLVLHTLFHARNEYVFWGWSDLIIPLTLYLLFLPGLSCLNIGSSLFARKSFDASAKTADFPLFCLRVHVSVFYFVVAWSRLNNSFWQDGSMLYRILADNLYSRVPQIWASLQWPLVALTYLFWLIELVVPFSIWTRRWCRPTILALIVMHLGLESLAMVGWWNAVMIPVLLILYSDNRPNWTRFS